jgi:carotenoid 1,2-hydratase
MMPAPPTRPGAYRWFYVDLTHGDLTAVVIFMVGSVFSPYYSRSWKGGARPLEHCAVNLAVYQGGARRAWVLSEYRQARWTDSELTIGRSSLRVHPSGRLEVELDELTTPWRQAVRARLTLEPEVGPLAEQQLVAGAPHYWQPLAARARGRFELPSLGLDLTGRGYHDTNHGEEPLGQSVPGWTWQRVHTPSSSHISYWPRTGDGWAPGLEVLADDRGVRRLLGPPPALGPTAISRWRLAVPTHLSHGPVGLAATPPLLLESSPFYARLEASRGEVHALAEVADFERFHRPEVRWMAEFRTRRVSS